MSLVDRVLGRGESKTSVVTRRGTQIDLRVVAQHQLGAALLYFTGSKGHNIKLRQRALARGLTLNEYALSEIEGGRVVASETEEQIYKALDLPFIPPVLREDAGEIEAAEKGALPAPDAAGDRRLPRPHHRLGRRPLAARGGGRGGQGARLPGPGHHRPRRGDAVGRQPREKLLEQRERFRALQAELGDSLRLLHGVELNIGRDGELDYDLEFRRGFDWCLASVHDHFELDRAAQTKRVVTAMRDPAVRMIGHLSARMIGGRPPIDLDIDAIATAAEETGTALEVNGALPRLDLSVEALRHARARDVTFLLTSDAHRAEELERARFAALNAERAWVDPATVANTWAPERLLKWIADGGPTRLAAHAGRLFDHPGLQPAALQLVASAWVAHAAGVPCSRCPDAPRRWPQESEPLDGAVGPAAALVGGEVVSQPWYAHSLAA